jgi:membrane-bound metal-dependent hydrolase YbcI (DUF457 family)
LYREGHAGLSFLLFSPFMFLFRAIGADMNYVVLTCVLMVALSSIPDLDIQWEIKHRGITHTFLFGAVVGVLFAIMLGYAYGPLGWLMGFVAGFGGTASHLLGDAFTYSPFKPFYPFSDTEVAYGFFKASNKTANSTMLVLGIFAFIISYEPSIIQQILGSL